MALYGRSTLCDMSRDDFTVAEHRQGTTDTRSSGKDSDRMTIKRNTIISTVAALSTSLVVAGGAFAGGQSTRMSDTDVAVLMKQRVENAVERTQAADDAIRRADVRDARQAQYRKDRKRRHKAVKKARKQARAAGYQDGSADGYVSGNAAGYSSGSAAGYASGNADGYASGTADGYFYGSVDGYVDGYYDGS